MQSIQESYASIGEKILTYHYQYKLSERLPVLVAVSKRQPDERIDFLLELGHRDFGENHIQEAEARWVKRKNIYADIRLHLIGPLQSNKVRQAVALFDVIHSVDREKIARAIKKECDAQQKEIPCLIQINSGDESQKSGVAPTEAAALIGLCKKELHLPIEGLMCIPPHSEPSAPHFALLNKLAKKHDLPELSMGMSDDYETAIRFGATYIRVGTKLFGERIR